MHADGNGAFTDDVDCVREDELRRDEVVNCGVL